MIMYHQLSGRRTNAVFCGPSGCGKSEIRRCLAKEYPGLVRMVDFSRFSAEGWNGSLHLRVIFTGTDPAAIRRRGLLQARDLQGFLVWLDKLSMIDREATAWFVRDNRDTMAPGHNRIAKRLLRGLGD